MIINASSMGATHINSDNDHQIEGSSINDLGEALSPPSTKPKAHQAIGLYQKAGPYLKTLLLNIWCYVFKTAVSLLRMTDIHYTLSKIMSSASNLEESSTVVESGQHLLDCIMATLTLLAMKICKT